MGSSGELVAQPLEKQLKQMAKYLKKLKGGRKQKLERTIALLKYYNSLDLKKTGTLSICILFYINLHSNFLTQRSQMYM